ncbi:MFS transporter [Nocardioides mesophilus]|uniref:MFS transporter n=1 Tax=Nocardioides mesophilus TaxID=433659 RepID=A0A7G9RFE1_9ACTN|nr:MFS transporter [Nocardioides mesophilus]QNN54316.1 MFS transporter [Nocardioides mesophilus]
MTETQAAAGDELPRACQGTGEPFVRPGTAAARWLLAAAVLGSGMAMLDGTVVNVALRSIGDDLDATVSQLQWVVNAYLLTLASLILVAGALGDRYGRRRVFVIGIAWFGVASLLCALARSPEQLIAARLVQGVGAALLTPGSLAIIQGSFPPADRGTMIGRWAGLGGIAAAIGPPLGGWVVEVATWRWVFWFNVPIAVLVVLISRRHVPESRDTESTGGRDVLGSVLAVAGLGGVTYALIESGTAAAVPLAVLGGLALVGFLLTEARTAHPVMPLHLFRSRVFSIANAMTVLVYGALGAVSFFLVLQLQVSAGYTPLEAGFATLPTTLVMLLLSSRSGALSARIGPRTQMTVGPLGCAAGVFWLREVGPGADYVSDVLPGLLLYSLGLVALVAPLTTSVMAAAPDRYAGVASGINNAVARTGSLLAVAALPPLVGLTGADYEQPAVFTEGYLTAMTLCAALMALGGVISFVGLAGTRDVAAARR